MSKEASKTYKARIHSKMEPTVDRAPTAGEGLENGGRQIGRRPPCEEQFRTLHRSKGTGYDSYGKPVELDFE